MRQHVVDGIKKILILRMPRSGCLEGRTALVPISSNSLPASEAKLELALKGPDDACMADYFISYTQSDREWAQWIGKELEAVGHTPHIHEWEIGGGENIYGWIETSIDAAHHMLCVV